MAAERESFAECLPAPGRFHSLASLGFSVIPVRHPDRDPDAPNGKKGKDAAIAWKPFQAQKASTTLLDQWEQSGEQYNVGVVTGAISGVVILDVDSPEVLVDLEARGLAIPTTPSVKTGRGWHHYFCHPGEKIGNRTRLGGIAGLDLRGDGGLAIGPGSVHENGKRYAWEVSPEDVTYAPLPDWVIELHRRSRAPAESGVPAHKGRPLQSPKIGDYPYIRAALVREADSLERTSKGARNDQLNRAAFNLAQLVAAGVLTRSEVYDTIRSACEQNGLIQDDGESAFEDSFDSGFTAGLAHPRALNRATGQGPQQPTPSRDEAAPDALFTAPFTDLGNAERLEELHGQRIRYCMESGWLVWNGSVWEQDPGPLVPNLAAETARATLRASADLADEDRRGALAKHALRSESAHRVGAAVTLARGFPNLHVKASQLDAGSWLLNAPNGLIDLRTGELRPHDASALCTRITGVPCGSTSDCARWEEFLLEVFNGDAELAYFMKRAIGYTLTGETSEHALFFLWGSGANGKTVFLEALRYVLGSYSKTAPMALWLSDRNDHANAATPDLAALRGARFVTSLESNAERRLNEGLVKGVTGGDRVTARELFGRPFEFEFQGKIFCASNHRPVIKGTDEGIWRRFLLIPFTRTFAPEERDKHLLDKLKAEGSAILRWAVEGCLEWQREGFDPPELVRIACQEYREEQDPLGVWITERCVKDPNRSCPTAELYRDYAEWMGQSNEEAMTADRFSKELGGRGFTPHRTKSARLRRGLALRSQDCQTDLAMPEEVTGDR